MYEFGFIPILIIGYGIYGWRKRKILDPWDLAQIWSLLSGKGLKYTKGSDAKADAILYIAGGIFLLILYLGILIYG